MEWKVRTSRELFFINTNIIMEVQKNCKAFFYVDAAARGRYNVNKIFYEEKFPWSKTSLCCWIPFFSG